MAIPKEEVPYPKIGRLTLYKGINAMVSPTERITDAIKILKRANALNKESAVTFVHLNYAEFEKEVVRALLIAQEEQCMQQEFLEVLNALQEFINSDKEYERRIASSISSFFVLSVAMKLGFKIIESSPEVDVRFGIDYFFVKGNDVFNIELKNYSPNTYKNKIKEHNHRFSVEVGYNITESQDSAIERGKKTGGYTVIPLLDRDSHYWIVTPYIDPTVVADLFNADDRGPTQSRYNKIGNMLSDPENFK